jgi:hypothetical protein
VEIFHRRDLANRLWKRAIKFMTALGISEDTGSSSVLAASKVMG